MRICYVALTCEAYLKTRAVWQRETWLSAIDPEDSYVYLSALSHPEDPHILGCGTADDYQSCPAKYIAFFKGWDLSGFDWYFFVDDDTFVFPHRLKAELAKHDASEYVYIGCEGNRCIPYMSGGAGFGLSAPLYTALVAGHRSGAVYTPERVDGDAYQYGDVRMGGWIYNLPVPTSRRALPRVSGMPLDHPGSPPLETALTSHYMKEEHFRAYHRVLKLSTRCVVG